MTSKRALVIEDDKDIALSLRILLERAGLEVALAAGGRDGLRVFHSVRPDLVVLDVGLPQMDGWTVLERIRDISDVPVLMLTARGHEADKVRGLRGGADDYQTKPYGNAELTARVLALLRRRQPAAASGAEEPEVFDDGLVELDFTAREVRVNGERVTLTPTEFRLLAALVRHKGQVLSPETLLELAWSDPFGIGPDRVKYTIMRLRRKLGDGGETRATPIESVRGFGYRYQAMPPPGGNAGGHPPATRRRQDRGL
jgi:DNA-binding response OmpR family regulator